MADFYNQERYLDPTAYAALTAIERSEHFRPLVYICSPYAGDIENNNKNTRKYSRFAVDKHCIPIAPHLLLPQFISEETERDLALFMGIVLLTKCSELWAFGDYISSGMATEIAKAKKKGIPIRYFTDEMEEKYEFYS